MPDKQCPIATVIGRLCPRERCAWWATCREIIEGVSVGGVLAEIESQVSQACRDIVDNTWAATKAK